MDGSTLIDTLTSETYQELLEEKLKEKDKTIEFLKKQMEGLGKSWDKMYNDLQKRSDAKCKEYKERIKELEDEIKRQKKKGKIKDRQNVRFKHRR